MYFAMLLAGGAGIAIYVMVNMFDESEFKTLAFGAVGLAILAVVLYFIGLIKTFINWIRGLSVLIDYCQTRYFIVDFLCPAVCFVLLFFTAGTFAFFAPAVWFSVHAGGLYVLERTGFMDDIRHDRKKEKKPDKEALYSLGEVK